MAKPILLVEDNAQDEFFTLRALEKAKLLNPVVVARDGQQALDYLFGSSVVTAGDLPVIILLDVNLPRVNGIEVLERIRSNSATQFVPVIMFTSSDEERDRLASYARGANSFVQKPVRFAEFAEKVSQIGVYWLAVNLSP